MVYPFMQQQWHVAIIKPVSVFFGNMTLKALLVPPSIFSIRLFTLRFPSIGGQTEMMKILATLWCSLWSYVNHFLLWRQHTVYYCNMYERIPMPTRRRLISFINFFIVFTCKLATLYSKQLLHLLDMYVYVDAMYTYFSSCIDARCLT